LYSKDNNNNNNNNAIYIAQVRTQQQMGCEDGPILAHNCAVFVVSLHYTTQRIGPSVPMFKRK